jgi:hypothetical protein
VCRHSALVVTPCSQASAMQRAGEFACARCVHLACMHTLVYGERSHCCAPRTDPPPPPHPRTGRAGRVAPGKCYRLYCEPQVRGACVLVYVRVCVCVCSCGLHVLYDSPTHCVTVRTATTTYAARNAAHRTRLCRHTAQGRVSGRDRLCCDAHDCFVW